MHRRQARRRRHIRWPWPGKLEPARQTEAGAAGVPGGGQAELTPGATLADDAADQQADADQHERAPGRTSRGPPNTRSDLGLYVHLHCLVTDGAYDEGIADVRFLPAPTPTPERMQAVLAQVHEAIAPVAEVDDLDLDPELAACVQLALTGPHLAPPPEPATRPPLTMSAFGMQLHAATTVDGRERKQLERICRYMLRPPFAHDAVQALPDGRVRVHFRAPWRSGAAHADMSPDKFLARLCGLVPPPGFHMTRYFGVFANRHHLRARIIPPAVVPAPEQQLTLRLAADDDDDDAKADRGNLRMGEDRRHVNTAQLA